MPDSQQHLHVAIPILNEDVWLPRTLDALANQTNKNFTAWFCVNQPDDWHNKPEFSEVCAGNLRCLQLLSRETRIAVNIIDRSSPGRGWQGKEGGVGWGRRVLMDSICQDAQTKDIIVSLDADTTFPEYYLESVQKALAAPARPVALTIPYYHQLTGEETLDRLILRYELFLRYYVINLWRIGSPYAFTALGSAIALPVAVYRAVGGITPKKAGEDFYFLQKLTKYGALGHCCSAKVYPAVRFSQRVPFGTGAALRAGEHGEWYRYPLYPMRLFDDIEATLRLFTILHEQDSQTPLTAFLAQQLNTTDIWGPLRKNHPDRKRFIRACHERLDSLRMLQYLKAHYVVENGKDEINLEELVRSGPPSAKNLPLGQPFAKLTISELDQLRNYLADWEDTLRQGKRSQNE